MISNDSCMQIVALVIISEIILGSSLGSSGLRNVFSESNSLIFYDTRTN